MSGRILFWYGLNAHRDRCNAINRLSLNQIWNRTLENVGASEVGRRYQSLLNQGMGETLHRQADASAYGVLIPFNQGMGETVRSLKTGKCS